MSRASANFAKSKFVLVNGEKLPLTYAMKKYKLNHYTINRKIVLGLDGFKGFPDTKTFKEVLIKELYSRFPNAPTKEQILTAKKERISLKSFVGTDVKYNTINTLCLLHGFPTKFDQIPQEVNDILTENVLKVHLKNNWSAARIAKKYSVSPSLILQKIHSFGLYVPPSYESVGESEVKEYIQSLGFTTKKHKTPTYEIDVFIPELNIGVEFNGIYWHTKYDRKYHQQKYLAAKEDGIRLIQMWDQDWINKQDLIKRKLSHLLGKDSTKIFARKCKIEEIPSKELRKFYTENHIQGYKATKSNFVLTYNNEIVSAISISGDKIERFASSVSVVGGFSRLLKHAIETLGLKQVVTFADLFWSDHMNNQYAKNGFDFAGITTPNYFWCKGREKHSRIKFQKHKLRKLPNYTDKKTETQIMTENGYSKLFDAGNAKFILSVSARHK